MIIKKIAVGNSTEAFVEDGFTDGLNIFLVMIMIKEKQLPCNL